MVWQEEIVYQIDVKRSLSYELEGAAKPFVFCEQSLVFSEESEEKDGTGEP